MEDHTERNMLKLEQVSKIYSAHGVISTGFNKVNLEFKSGEFVAITGESGSGKSTLLNVISGLDSYEEGEMYIMGQPTSGYSKEDMENYRKEYIGNIFQSFNLINSYTVYQNVELVLLLSGYKKEDVRERVREIIAKVGLSEYEKTKTSKLSGGQKQRVAIARALAKETPIIVADEPTGNLDSKSAAEIIRLLHEISKEKLIIIVTHNYDQVEPYVTRKIQMHDGRVIEDKKFTEQKPEESEKEEPIKKAKADTLSFGNMLQLSIRNTFNIPAKFFLLLTVFLFLCAGVIASYTTTTNLKDTMANEGYNEFFSDTGKERLLITRQDKELFTEEDYQKLKSVSNVKSVIRQDLFMDSGVELIDGSTTEENSPFYLSLKPRAFTGQKFKLKEGRMPENGNEALIIYKPEDTDYLSNIIDEVMEKEVQAVDIRTAKPLTKKNFRVVGYGYTEEDINQYSGQWYEGWLYVGEGILNDMNYSALERYCSQEIEFADTILENSSEAQNYPLRISAEVPEGQIYIPEEIDNLTEKRTIGMPLILRNKSIYFNDSFTFSVGAVYKKNNLKHLLNLENFDEISGSLFLNPADYEKIFSKGNYQSSVVIDDLKEKPATVSAVKKAGYNVFDVSKGIIPYFPINNLMGNIVYTGMLIVSLLVLFFISYFIMKLILKSRNIYFSTIRMLGATKKNCGAMLRTELFVVFNLAFLLCAGAVALAAGDIIHSNTLYNIVSILQTRDYILLYALLCLMSILLAGRYARQMFRKVAMDAYREEV